MAATQSATGRFGRATVLGVEIGITADPRTADARHLHEAVHGAPAGRCRVAKIDRDRLRPRRYRIP